MRSLPCVKLRLTSSESRMRENRPSGSMSGTVKKGAWHADTEPQPGKPRPRCKPKPKPPRHVSTLLKFFFPYDFGCGGWPRLIDTMACT